MLVGPDVRMAYDETRKIGFGFIRGRLMAVVFTERATVIHLCAKGEQT